MLREETDLDALSNVLTSAVGKTLQPAHVSLGLREPELPPRGSEGPEESAYPMTHTSRPQCFCQREHPVRVAI